MNKQQTEVTKETQDSGDQSRYVIPSLDSAIQILKYLSRSKNKTATLTKISSDFDMNRSTTYRILTTLKLNNMVEYEPSDRTYRLGIEVAVLGARAVTLNEFLHRAAQVIQRIAKDTGNTTVLVQRVSPDKIAYVLKAEPETSIRISATLGQVYPITAGSHGKLFLAHMDVDERQDILEQLGYPRYTEHTISREKLEEELVHIREAGVAISWEEHFVGVAGVAVPVFHGGSQMTASISCIAMTARASLEQMQAWGQMMTRLVETEL